jgi:type IV pilus assembly protein PilB
MAANDEQVAQILVNSGIISAEQVAEARSQAEASGSNLVQAMLRLRMITALDIAKAAEQLPPEVAPAAPAAPPAASGAQRPARPRPPAPQAAPPTSSLGSYEVDPEALREVPRALAERYLLLPLQMSGDRLLVAMVDATNVFAIDELRSRTGRKIESIEVSEEELRPAIEQYYANLARSQVNVSATSRDLSESLSRSEGASGIDNALAEMLDQAPVVRIVEQILKDAVRVRASDIHIEPRDQQVAVRFRVDGQLQTVTMLPIDMHRYVLSRIKIMAGEDIAETRVPQDGRFATVVDDRPIDLRVSTLPTFWGEKAVMRILDKSRALVSLSQLGFMPETRKSFEDLLSMSQGMLLVTGPTGSGKTTTLYASLHAINDETKNITTVEDPIEYEVSGLNQVQVHPQIDLTFSAALRSILRQDPDVVLVGEIRDIETAEMAFRAALTGHLVLSTLHTNDAPSAATRLVDMGIPAYIIASTVTGVLAQRLVRKLCSHCREACDPTEAELERLQMSAEQSKRVQFHRGRGCTHCRNTGYNGRIALYELMTINNDIREAVSSGMNAAQVRAVALKSGMRSLKYDGLSKVNGGVTSAREVIGVMFAGDIV